MVNKRQLNKAEEALWNKFTQSIKISNREKYHSDILPVVNSVDKKESNRPRSSGSNYTLLTKKTLGLETSLFVQHYKLFKAQQLHSTTKGSFKSIGERQAGLDISTWKRLQKGEIKATRKLDLHGFTAHQAFLILENFLMRAYQHRIRCVEVITGVGNLSQGGGILKRELPHWLNRPYMRSIILASSYINPRTGGAVRILLKKNR